MSTDEKKQSDEEIGIAPATHSKSQNNDMVKTILGVFESSRTIEVSTAASRDIAVVNETVPLLSASEPSNETAGTNGTNGTSNGHTSAGGHKLHGWGELADKVHAGDLLLEDTAASPRGITTLEDRLERRERAQEEIRSRYEWSFWHYLAVVVIFLGVSVVCFSYIFERLSIIDALYFAIVTGTTVGYGDLSPESNAGRIFTIFYTMVGVMFVGIVLGELGTDLIEAEEAAVEEARDSAKKRVLWLFGSAGAEEVTSEEDAIEHEAKKEKEFAEKASPIFKLLSTFLAIMMFLSLFAILLFEEPGVDGDSGKASVSFLDAFYFSIITATTVGYGDMSPITQRGRLLAIFFIPLAVGTMGKLLGDIASLIIETRAANVREEFASKALSLEAIENMDVDGDGQVTRGEFLEFMLVAMDKIDEDLVMELREHFKRLDVDGTGVLSKQDLIVTARTKLHRIKNKLELSAYKQELLRKANANRVQKRKQRTASRAALRASLSGRIVPSTPTATST